MKPAPDEVEMRRAPAVADHGPLFQALTEPLLAPRDTRKVAELKAESTADKNRAKLLQAYRTFGPMTADQAGERCGLHFMEARPRASELLTGKWQRAQHPPQLRDTGRRLPSALGNPQAVLEVVA